MALNKLSWTQIPNLYIDNYMNKLKSYSTEIFLAICRKTIGWHKETDVISLSQLVSITGLNKKTVQKGIKELINNNLIEVDRTGSGRGIRTTYSLKFEKEKSIRVFHTPILKINGVRDTPLIQANGVSRTPLNQFIGVRDTPTKESNIKKNNIKKDPAPGHAPDQKIQDLFNFWNSLEKVIKHRDFDTHKKNIEKELKKPHNSNIDTVKKVMGLYNRVLGSGKEVFHGHKYRWTIAEFLSRGVPKYLDKSIEDFYDKSYFESQEYKNKKSSEKLHAYYEEAKKRHDAKRRHEK